MWLPRSPTTPPPPPPVAPPRIPPPAAAAPTAEQQPAQPQAAERRIGKYIVKRELGRGGMGTIYPAEQPGLGREGAIKEPILSPGAGPTALKRFIQEAQVMARAHHPKPGKGH